MYFLGVKIKMNLKKLNKIKISLNSGQRQRISLIKQIYRELFYKSLFFHVKLVSSHKEFCNDKPNHKR